MKIKQDFVTNSSSTSFIFIFKGNHRTHLFEKMVNYGDQFKVYNEYESGSKYVDVWEIIQCIDPIISSHIQDPWHLPGPLKLSELFETYDKTLKEYKTNLIEELKEEKEDPKRWVSSKYTKEHIEDIEDKISIIKKAIEDGLDHYVEISFGDNDGMIQGGRVGTNMDYSGRNININEKDFVVIVESQH